MDEKSIANLQSNFCKVLVRPVHRVSKLQCGNGFPSLFLKETAGFFRSGINAFEFFWIFSLAEYFDWSREIEFSLCHHLCHSGMLDVIGFKDLSALMDFVNLIFLMGHHTSHQLIIFIINQNNE